MAGQTRIKQDARKHKDGGYVLNKGGKTDDENDKAAQSPGETETASQRADGTIRTDAVGSQSVGAPARIPFQVLSPEDSRQFGLCIQAIAKRQDRASFRQLFAHFAPRIRTMLRRAGCTSEAAEDLTQDCMLAVWRKASYFDPARASASTWIYAIARNLRIDVARRERRARLHTIAETHQPAPEAPDQPDDLTDQMERQERVQAALKHLPPEQLQVVMASFVEGKAHSQIASELGIPIGTVKSRMRLAMGRLRPVLEDLQ